MTRTLTGRRLEIASGRAGLAQYKVDAYRKMWAEQGYELPSMGPELQMISPEIIATPLRELTPAQRGPGSQLKSWLHKLGFKPRGEDCQCETHADEMDRQGCDWCLENLDTIYGWLKESADKQGVVIWGWATKQLVKQAIKSSRRAQEKLRKEEVAAQATIFHREQSERESRLQAMQAEGQGLVTWAIGVTTSPRNPSTLARCVASIRAAGWDELTIFAEPGTDVSDVRNQRSGVSVVQRPHKFGCWQNYLQTLRDLLTRNHEASAIAIFQDDIVLAKDIRSFLDAGGKRLWPGGAKTGCVSLYSPESYETDVEKSVRFRHINSRWLLGACAMIYPRHVAEALVTRHTSWRGRAKRTAEATDPTKKKATDTWIGHAIAAEGLQALFPTRSLCQHIADKSAVGHGGREQVRKGRKYRRSAHFVGEQVSAWEAFGVERPPGPVRKKYKYNHAAVRGRDSEGRNLLSPTAISNMAIASMRSRSGRGMSLIRIGDGEALLLGPRHRTLQRQLRLWFGRDDFSNADVLHLRDQIIAAFRVATVLGVPSRDDGPEWDAARKKVERAAIITPQHIITSCWAHRWCWDSGDLHRVIQSADSITLVTCRTSVVDQFRRLWPDKMIEYIAIPDGTRDESRFERSIDGGTRHWESVPRIRERCRAIRSDLTLVGGGVLGKLYTADAAAAGSVAIDAGSLFDGWAGLATRQTMRGRLDEYKLQRHTTMFFWKGEHNFGDALNESLMPALLDRKIVWDTESAATCVGIGSVLDRVAENYPGTICGAGFIRAGAAKQFPNANLAIVRGKLTATRVSARANTTIGDPGLLSERLIIARPAARFLLGLIPHYVDQRHPAIEKIASTYPSDVLVIDVRQSCAAMMRQVAHCANIASSSLHGLIAADALGLPSTWLVLSAKIIGGEYKYRDYFSAFAGADRAPLVVGNDHHITLSHLLSMAHRTPPAEIEFVKERLLRQFIELSARL